MSDLFSFLDSIDELDKKDIVDALRFVIRSREVAKLNEKDQFTVIASELPVGDVYFVLNVFTKILDTIEGLTYEQKETALFFLPSVETNIATPHLEWKFSKVTDDQILDLKEVIKSIENTDRIKDTGFYITNEGDLFIKQNKINIPRFNSLEADNQTLLAQVVFEGQDLESNLETFSEKVSGQLFHELDQKKYASVLKTAIYNLNQKIEESTELGQYIKQKSGSIFINPIYL